VTLGTKAPLQPEAIKNTAGDLLDAAFNGSAAGAQARSSGHHDGPQSTLGRYRVDAENRYGSLVRISDKWQRDSPILRTPNWCQQTVAQRLGRDIGLVRHEKDRALRHSHLHRRATQERSSL